MKTKKITALIAAGILSVSFLASCSAAQKDAPDAAQTASAVQAEALTQVETRTETETETQTEPMTQSETTTQAETAAPSDAYRAAYARQLAKLRADYGTPKGFYDGQMGVSFADLIDWDADGTPELVVLIHEDGAMYEEQFSVKIYTEKNGKAVSLLDTRVGSSYGFLSSDLLFDITKPEDGKLIMRVDDSHDYADLKETYYTLSDGSVRSTVLAAQSSVGGWVGEDADTRPVDPDAYQIDGKTCTKAAFDARQAELNGDEIMSVLCQYIYDLQALDDFLSGKSDTYNGGALLKANDLLLGDEGVSWLPDAIFTVGA